jgi:hypothetical protein
MQDASMIVWPVILQVLLTFAAYVVLGRRRFAAVKRGDAKPIEYKYGTGGPNYVMLATRNVANQFELPVLFYVLVILLIVLGEVNSFQVVMAWLFVAARYIHAYGHMQDILKPRFIGFFASLFACLAMWIGFAAQISLSVI